MKAILVAVLLQVSLPSDDFVDWVSIGISTGKFSESISSNVFGTEAECRGYKPSEDNTCFPIPALPREYWAQKKKEADDALAQQKIFEQSDEGKAQRAKLEKYKSDLEAYNLCSREAPSISEIFTGKDCVVPEIPF